jgi:transposase
MVMTDWRSGKRRQYSVAFKRQVLSEAAAPGVTVSSVARRHGLNANLIFNWRRRFGATSAPAFVPAVIVRDSPPPDSLSSDPADDRSVSGDRMEVVCLGGRRIVLGPDFDASAVGRLLAVVEGP